MPGWRDSRPLASERVGAGWRWIVPVTPPDSPQAVTVTLRVFLGDRHTWHWEVTQPSGSIIWAGTGSSTLPDAATRACRHLTAQLGVPLAVLA